MSSRALLPGLKLPKRIRFDQPPGPNVTRINVFGEIATATEFNANYLYIDFELDLPKAYRSTPSNPTPLTEFSTHCTWPLKKSFCDWSGNLFNLAFPMEFELETENLGEEFESPILYFQVNSIDTWDRHRIEGYGYLELPKSPGSYHLEIPTWRPVGTIRDELRRFFVGGGLMFKDKKMVHTRASTLLTNSRKFESRQPWRTVAAGNIQIHLEIVHTVSANAVVQNLKKSTILSRTLPPLVGRTFGKDKALSNTQPLRLTELKPHHSSSSMSSRFRRPHSTRSHKSGDTPKESHRKQGLTGHSSEMSTPTMKSIDKDSPSSQHRRHHHHRRKGKGKLLGKLKRTEN